jgi:hypothetical protein
MHVDEAVAVGPIEGGGAAGQRRGQRVVAHKPETTEAGGQWGGEKEKGGSVGSCVDGLVVCV